MSQHFKKEEGQKRSEFYSKRYDYYTLLGYPVCQASKLAHRDWQNNLNKKIQQKKNLNRFEKTRFTNIYVEKPTFCRTTIQNNWAQAT